MERTLFPGEKKLLWNLPNGIQKYKCLCIKYTNIFNRVEEDRKTVDNDIFRCYTLAINSKLGSIEARYTSVFLQFGNGNFRREKGFTAEAFIASRA